MNREKGEDDPNIARDLASAKARFEQRLQALGTELEGYWREWDALIDRGGDGQERAAVRDKMVDLLNRRSYIRNLVRDVNEALAA